MTGPVILVERPAEHVALIRINRPDVRNALNLEVRRGIAAQLAEMGQDPRIRCIIMAGDDKAFAAGADIKEMAGVEAMELVMRGTDRLWRAIASCHKPVIAAVRGLALGGGCELAMTADIIIAGESARFGQPEVRIGVMPGGGGTQRLMRAVGKYKAMKILLSGDLFDAGEADAMGLVSEVVPDAEVEPRAIALASQISAFSPLAVQQIKEVAMAGQDASLDAALRLETKAIQVLFSSHDRTEGMQAFMEKRPPCFQGR